MNLENRLLEYMRARLNPHRLEHSLGVADTARRLALRYQSDEQRAYLSGLAHDISKWMDDGQLLLYAQAHGLPIDGYERRQPGLLHAKISENILKDEFSITDEKILSAVRRHICGSPDMTKLDAVVCLADWIEPGRSYEDIPALRRLAEISLEDALATAIATTVCVEFQKKNVVHPLALETYNALRLMLERKETLI